MPEAQAQQTADFTWENHGSIMTCTPNADVAQDWLDEHVGEDAQRWCGGVVVEPRYAADLAAGIADDGFTQD